MEEVQSIPPAVQSRKKTSPRKSTRSHPWSHGGQQTAVRTRARTELHILTAGRAGLLSFLYLFIEGNRRPVFSECCEAAVPLTTIRFLKLCLAHGRYSKHSFHYFIALFPPHSNPQISLSLRMKGSRRSVNRGTFFKSKYSHISGTNTSSKLPHPL